MFQDTSARESASFWHNRPLDCVFFNDLRAIGHSTDRFAHYQTRGRWRTVRQTQGLVKRRVWFSLLAFSAAVLLGLAAVIGGLQGLVGDETFRPLIRLEKSSDSHVLVTFLGRTMKGPCVPGIARGDVGTVAKTPAWQRRLSGLWAGVRGWGREVRRLFDEWRLDGSFSLQEKPVHR